MFDFQQHGQKKNLTVSSDVIKRERKKHFKIKISEKRLRFEDILASFSSKNKPVNVQVELYNSKRQNLDSNRIN